MQKILVMKQPEQIPDYAFVMAVIGTLGIETAKEPPSEDDLLAYYTETRTFAGTSPTNLETLKAALEGEVQVITYTNPKKFTDAIGEEFAAWIQTLPDEEGRNRMIEVLARTESLLSGMDAKKGRPRNCGQGTIRIQGQRANGQKYVQDICVACAKEAIAGNPNRIAMFNKPQSIQGLLAAVLGEASLQRMQ